MKLNFFYLLLLLVPFVVTSCADDDDPEIENEEELITDITLTFTPEGGGSDVTLTFADADGEGGNAPVITGGTLAANTNYDVVASFSNPEELIDTELLEEDDEHQVFYVVSSGLDATFTYDDMDGDGNPLGLKTKAVTGAAGSGTVTLVLRHEPTKGPSITIDNLAAAGGSTDAEVVYPVTIQ